MGETDDQREILDLIDTYVRAYETADADLMESLFWLGDPRFVEVENHISPPFGRDRFLAITDWMRDHQPAGWKMRFYDTQVHVLSPEVAYSVSLREQDEAGDVKTSRVTLILLKKNGEWRIIHGHFSFVPQ